MTDSPAKTDAAEQVANSPVLMLDTGGHMAIVTAITFTADGTELVSASDDKTIRVWNLETGKTVRTIRGESALGDQGKIYSIALSSDGKCLAAGGYLGESSSTIRVYEFLTGKLIALLEGHDDVVLALAFSGDGRHLLSGSGDKTACIWDVGTRQPKHWLRGHAAGVYAVSFALGGERAVTGSYDRDLRLWDASDGEQIAHMTGHGGRVRSIAATPDNMVVSGDMNGEMRLWNGRTGSFRKVLVRQRTSVLSLSVSPDGKRLLSGTGGLPLNCQVYDLPRGKKIITYSGHDNIIGATAISLDGRWAATGGGNNHEIHLWDLHSGKPRLGPGGQPLRLRGQGRPVWAVGYSADGRRVGWGYPHRLMVDAILDPFQHALALPLAEVASPNPQSIGWFASRWRRVRWLEKAAWWVDVIWWVNTCMWLHARWWRSDNGEFCRAIHELSGWSLSHPKTGHSSDRSTLDIKCNRRAVASIKRNSKDHCYTFTSDGKTIIAGGGYGELTAYDRAGNKLGNFVGHEADVLDVAPSPDGRLVLSGSADQTVRLWNLKTRELLINFFHGQDGEWVMWTPQGYYISSLDGDRLIGWHINHGPDNAADYVRASQLSGKLFRPDIVARTIELASAKAALAELGAPANIIDLLRVSRPPEFRILLPETGSTMPDTPASVVVEVAANPDPVEGYDIMVNGRQVATRDLHLRDFGERPARKTLPVPLERGDNAIRILARNRIGTAERELLLRFLGQSELDKRGTLYVVAVGVDAYTNAPHKTLRFAGADARAFCETMLRHVAPMYERAECLLLAKGGDKEPTRANIENAMLLFRKAEPQDTVVLFLAGHGANDGANYVFLPQDVAADGTHFLPATVVRWHVFQEALQIARGRRLMFVDTCHSGGAYNARLVKDAHDASIIVFSATDSTTLALELADLGHGAFTFALIQGLGGEADVHRQGEVELFALQSYVSREVRNLTSRRQAPAIHLSGVTDFVIARK